MKRLDGIKAWIGDREGAVRGVLVLSVSKDEHCGGIKCVVEIEVRDKFGNVIEHKEQVSKSFNKDFFNIVAQLFTLDPSITPAINILATDGVAYLRSMSTLTDAGDWADAPGAGVDSYGIRVGTSTTAWDFNQYNLQAAIAHGTGVGQLSYNACTVSDMANTGAPAMCTMQRSFDNNSGSSITVNEIGWFGVMKIAGGTFKYHMIGRDVITATAVPNGGRLTITYKILVNPT